MSEEHVENATQSPSEPLPAGEPSAQLPMLVRQPPLPVPHPPAPVRPRRRRKLILGALLLLLGAIGGGYWWLHRGPALPPGFASGNGRLEADEIDIDTKFAGRIAKLIVDQGDMVQAGQILAVMDTQDLEATLRRTEAVVLQSQRALEEANANVVQQQSQVQLAKLELQRARYLVQKHDMSDEIFDQRKQQMDGANAALTAAIAKVGEAEHALDAAKHDVELYKVNIADNSLVAPRQGPIEYRVANVGEVLPAGGKVFTMLDASYVYMDIYLPTAEAGRVRIGAETRIVLDAYPDHVIPASVVFVARMRSSRRRPSKPKTSATS